MKVYKFTMDFNKWRGLKRDLTEGKEYFLIGGHFNDDVGYTRNVASWKGDKTELIEKPKEELSSLQFLEMIRKEWCKSEEQWKPFWNDVMTFARKYHKEMKDYEKYNF